MKWDPEPVDRVLRGHGLTLEPIHYLDDPPQVGPDRWECVCLGRMGYQLVGKRVVRWTGSKWELEKGKAEKREQDDPLLGRLK